MSTQVQVVSVLFSDIVGSTELLSRLGPDAYDRIRHEILALLRAATVSEQGTEVKNLGDGTMAVFPSAGAAIRAACEMQRALARRRQIDPDIALLRVGVAVGEATTEEGDYFGEPIVVAARLCDLAKSGQVLATALTGAMAGRRLDVELRDLGDIDVRGLEEPVATVEADWQAGRLAKVPMPNGLRALPQASFIGRHIEVGVLREAWDKVLRGQTRVVLVSGEPGIGKTRLAAQAAAEVSSSGGVVSYGRCEDGLPIPYGPWIDALCHLVRHLGETPMSEYARTWGGDLAQMSPSLAVALDTPPAPTGEPEVARFRLIAATEALLDLAVAHGPTLIVLDDVHWAERETLLLLRHLVQKADGRPLLIVGTLRHTEVGPTHPIAELSADLRRDDTADHVRLTGLDTNELIEMLETLSNNEADDETRELAEDLRREANGNPFFVGEILRNLVESGHVAADDAGRWRMTAELVQQPLPESLREVVTTRVARLGGRTTELLSLAAVVGEEFSVDLVGVLAGLDGDAVTELAHAAIRASVLTENADRYGVFRFQHGLIRHILYQELGPTRRARIHRRVAEELELTGGPERAAELAGHWHAVPGASAEYLRAAVAAGDHALARLAPQEAMRWYAEASARLGSDPGTSPEAVCDVQTKLGEAQRQASVPAFWDTLLDAARMAEARGDGVRMGRALAATSRLFPSSLGTADEELESMFFRCLELLGDDAPVELRAQVQSQLATELTTSVPLHVRQAHADAAIALARQQSDPVLLARVLVNSAFGIWAPETLEHRRDLMTEAYELSITRDLFVAFNAVCRLLYGAFEEGDEVTIREKAAELQELGLRLPHPVVHWICLFAQSPLRLLAGELELAESTALAGFEVADAAGERDAFTLFGGQLFAIRWEQGRWEELVDSIAEAAADNPNLPVFQAGLALALCESNREAEARVAFDRLSAEGFRTLRRDPMWTTTMSIAGETAYRLGDTTAAAEIYELLLSADGHFCYTGATFWGSVARVLGLLAEQVGDRPAAISHLESALAESDRLQSPTLRARAGYHLGQVLARNADPRSAGLLEEARETWLRIGAPNLAERAAAAGAMLP
jgi:class 3 adenylate cyclase